VSDEDVVRLWHENLARQARVGIGTRSHRRNRSRDMAIVLLRCEGYTLDEIGRYERLSGERVRQICNDFETQAGVYAALRACATA